MRIIHNDEVTEEHTLWFT